MRLADKVAIVAGAGWGGIGAACAYRFAQEGAKLIVNALPGEERLFETVRQIQSIGGECAAVPGNVKHSSTWEAIVEAALDHYGRIDVLMNSAAGGTHSKRVLDFTEEEWDDSMQAIVKGSWLSAKYCIPEMIKVGGGSIVFTSTINALITTPHYGLYSTAKTGLTGLTRSLALEYGRQGIRCNAVAPAMIVSEAYQAVLDKDPLEIELSADLYPIGRYGSPRDIANVALFLASDEAAFVTGIVLLADGGLLLQSPEAVSRPSFRKRWRNNILVPRPLPAGDA